ncbi:MAG: flagellar protein FlgN [Candidatus Adiutrix sp.]|jgi:hypothetical protein|nr:flagellar protein FlgN [Candidatus Adiutrix sp.]
MDFLRIQRLCDILDEHLERYQVLVDHLALERKYLLALDLEALLLSSRQKEALGRDIQLHIQTLVEALGEAAPAAGLPSTPQPLLADLAARLPDPYRRRLNEGATRLARLKNIILRENEAGRAFIEESLRLLNESINILTGAGRLKGEGYTSGGGQGENRCTLPVKLSREV